MYALVNKAVQGYVQRTSGEAGRILDRAGSSFVEILDHLDDLHTRVSPSMPELRPPSFSCTDVTESTLLAPFVRGLLEAVGGMFGHEVTTSLVSGRGDDGDTDVFFVEYRAAAQRDVG